MRENTEFQVQAAKNRFEENSLRCCISDGECGMVTQEMWVLPLFTLQLQS